jgi:hypothetical protein
MIKCPRDINSCSIIMVVGAMLVAAPVTHGQGTGIPTEFQGDWVAAAAACTSPARIRLESARVTLVNAVDKESLGAVEMAGPGFFPPDYNGIQQVAIADLGGDQPFSITFNYQEKRGTALAEMAPPGPDRAGNAALNALNARLRKLNLAKRFPLHQVPLKKCLAAK